jgi:hypothetical protein
VSWKERDVIFLPENREICKALLETARERGGSTRLVGDLIVEVGLHLLSAPYEAGTLERKPGPAIWR